MPRARAQHAMMLRKGIASGMQKLAPGHLMIMGISFTVLKTCSVSNYTANVDASNLDCLTMLRAGLEWRQSVLQNDLKTPTAHIPLSQV